MTSSKTKAYRSLLKAVNEGEITEAQIRAASTIKLPWQIKAKPKLTGVYVTPEGSRIYGLSRLRGSQVVWISYTQAGGQVKEWATSKADAEAFIKGEKLVRVGDL